MSSVGPEQRLEHLLVPVDRLEPACGLQLTRVPSDVLDLGAALPRRGRRRRSPRSSAQLRAAWRRNGRGRRGRHWRGVRRGVDVGQLGQVMYGQPGRRAVRVGACRSPDATWARPRSSAGSGRRRPSSQKPPSAAGPYTASCRSSACPAARRSAGVTCGVSMPISTTGIRPQPVGVGEGRRQALVQPLAALRDHHESRRQPRPGSPSRASTRWVAGAAATACRLSPARPRRGWRPRPGCTAGSAGS